MVLLTIILCSKNAGTGYTAEQTQAVHEEYLIYDRHAGHLLGSHLPDHNVVQKADEVRDSILDHDGYGYRQYHFIESFISDEFAEKAGLLCCLFHF